MDQDDGFEMEPSQMTPNHSDPNITPPSVHGASAQQRDLSHSKPQNLHQKHQLSAHDALAGAHPQQLIYVEGRSNADFANT